MKRWALLWLTAALLVGVASAARSEASGYVSATYGFHENPLYNYEKLSDQIRQSYAELHYDHTYDASRFGLSYVGGLMLFNRFSERNYYEHNLRSTYSHAFRPRRPVPGRLPQGASGVAEPTTPEGPGAVPSGEDSSGSFLELGLKLGARHDKTAHRDFDNVGSAAASSYRLAIGRRFHLRASNTLDYRRYVYLAELTNLSDVVTLQAGVTLHPAVTFGVRVSGGLKHYTSSLYDTLRFEDARSYRSVRGKGKGGALLQVPSSKQLLLNADSDNIRQFSMETFLSARWTGGSSDLTCTVRHNPGLPSRYLAQYANTSILSEDIYLDHFAYEGPEAQLRVAQRLPCGVQSIVTVRHQRKRFGAPAVSLVGDQVAINRIDVRSGVEFYVSRYCQLLPGLGMDLAVGGELIRNQSNDVYNDYSHRQVSVSLGIGF